MYIGTANTPPAQLKQMGALDNCPKKQKLDSYKYNNFSVYDECSLESFLIEFDFGSPESVFQSHYTYTTWMFGEKKKSGKNLFGYK